VTPKDYVGKLIKRSYWIADEVERVIAVYGKFFLTVEEKGFSPDDLDDGPTDESSPFYLRLVDDNWIVVPDTLKVGDVVRRQGFSVGDWTVLAVVETPQSKWVVCRNPDYSDAPYLFQEHELEKVAV
jgi:hypothetical protein